MPGFDIGGAINSTASWVTSAPLVQCIVGNPVFTSILITTLCIIVIMGTYSRAVRREGNTKAARVALYVFMLVTAVTFMHHYTVMHMLRESSAQKGVQDVFSSIQQSRDNPSEAHVRVYTGAREDNVLAPALAPAAPAAALHITDVVLPEWGRQ